MRIIGGHDFFDSALAYGRDETLVFARKKFEDAAVHPHKNSPLAPLLQDTLDFELDRTRRRRENSIVHGKTLFRFEPQAVWFAGKRYGGIKVAAHAAHLAYWKPEETQWHWSHDQFVDFLKSIDVRLSAPTGWGWEYSLDSGNIADHFARPAKNEETDWLIENRVSIAIWQRSPNSRGNSSKWNESTGWKINTDGLGKLGFAKCLDPFTAFQELSMWIGGVLPRSENATVKITDEKIILDKHGMDEWSFKRLPGGRR